MIPITYVDLSGRGATDGIGNTDSADTGITGGAVDGEQIDQIGSFQMLANSWHPSRSFQNPANTAKKSQAFDGEEHACLFHLAMHKLRSHKPDAVS